MKQKVIEFFQNLPKEKYEKFNDAFELYRKSEGKSLGMEKGINAAGFSEHALGNLLYDLQKLHGITDVEKIQVVKSEKLVVSGEEIEGAFQSKYFCSKSAFEMTEEELIAWGVQRELSNGDLKEILALAINSNLDVIAEGLIKSLDEIAKIPVVNTEAPTVSTELDKENKALVLENEDLQDEKADLEEELEATVEENESLKDELDKLKSLPKIDAKSIRVEFPFLSEKECPDEFKILVADKITAWNRYLECHEEMLRIESGEVVETDLRKADLASNCIEAFTENQKIYDELVAYAETGKVLGVHPIFKKLQMTREVEEMTADELHNYKGSSAKYFSVNKTALAKAEKAKDTDKIELITNRVAERELRLALVNKKLGIKAK